MSTAPKLAVLPADQPRTTYDPADLLTAEELAQRLKVKPSWISEQTRKRARIRNKAPLPCVRLGKYVRFSWREVCAWMARNNT
jgi:predicted DNA-binding transcriptional regulator AlpA